MAKKTQLGWDSALKQAKDILSKRTIERSQHFEIFRKLLYTENDTDHRIALALLKLYIKNYSADFDRDILLEDITAYGLTLCNPHWKDYGRHVFLDLLKLREVSAAWIDDIADEKPRGLRLAFAVALAGLGKLKRVPESRTLGMLRFFLDQDDVDVREEVAKALHEIGRRDPQKLHYFLAEHESGAGSYRKALIARTRELGIGKPGYYSNKN